MEDALLLEHDVFNPRAGKTNLQVPRNSLSAPRCALGPHCVTNSDASIWTESMLLFLYKFPRHISPDNILEDWEMLAAGLKPMIDL